jgi:hypothetical protein
MTLPLTSFKSDIEEICLCVTFSQQSIGPAAKREQTIGVSASHPMSRGLIG